jgi:hypothetical protein
MNTNNAAGGLTARRGKVLCPLRAAETEEQQNKIFSARKKRFKLLRQMKGNSIND